MTAKIEPLAQVDELDLCLNKAPLCPYCGYEARDAWEIDFGPTTEGEAEIDCTECGESYLCHRVVDVSYTTKKPKEQP